MEGYVALLCSVSSKRYFDKEGKGVGEAEAKAKQDGKKETTKKFKFPHVF